MKCLNERSQISRTNAGYVNIQKVMKGQMVGSRRERPWGYGGTSTYKNKLHIFFRSEKLAPGCKGLGSLEAEVEGQSSAEAVVPWARGGDHSFDIIFNIIIYYLVHVYNTYLIHIIFDNI